MQWRKILRAHPWVLPMVRGCATISLAISTAAVTGHITNHIGLYKWGNDMEMPLNTSIALAGVSVAVFAISLYMEKVASEK